jgi:putative ABC transport system permease protein
VAQNAFGTGGFDRALAGVGGITRPLLFAIRNSIRRRARLALTLLTLGAGGLFFMSALNVRASMIDTLDRLFATRQFDLSVSLGAMYSVEKIERAIRQTPGVLRAEGWIATEGAIPKPGEDPAASSAHSAGIMAGLHGNSAPGGGPHGSVVLEDARFSVIALPPETRLLKPDIVEGRGLQPGEIDAMVVNTALAARLPQPKIGSEVTLRIGPVQKPWKIVGIAREPFSPSTAYIPLGYMEARGGHAAMANTLRLALEQTDPASINNLKAGLEQNLESEGVRALSSSSKADRRFSVDQHMVMIYVLLVVMSCILASVGGLGLMTTMSLNVMERRREMGVMRAIGASPSVVWLIVVAEGGVIGVLSWALAALAAWPVGNAIGNLMVRLMFKSGLNFFFELRGLLVWLVVSLCLGVAASFLPAWRASRQSVREAVGYE